LIKSRRTSKIDALIAVWIAVCVFASLAVFVGVLFNQ